MKHRIWIVPKSNAAYRMFLKRHAGTGISFPKLNNNNQVHELGSGAVVMFLDGFTKSENGRVLRQLINLRPDIIAIREFR